MKAMKKLVSAVLAMVCGIGLAVPVGVSAEELFDPIPMETGDINALTTVYDPCDVNHDGSVDIMDYIFIDKFLDGTKHIINYSQLDADRNLIVDYADSEYIMNHVIENYDYEANYISRTYAGVSGSYYVGGTVTETEIPFQYHSGDGVDGQSSSTTSIQYCEYVYSDHTQWYYFLPPVSIVTTNNQGNEPRGIVDGSDNRYSTTLPENKGIVRLETSDPDKTSYFIGTGFIVDEHTIATCAHNLYGKYETDATKHFFNTLTVKTHNSNGVVSTNLHPIAAHIPNDYKTNPTRENDYALITVEETLPATDYPRFAIGNYYNLSTANYNYIPVYVTGCPLKVHNSNNYTRLYSQMGCLSQTNNAQASVIKYNTDTTGGNSGSPVYTVIKDSDGMYYYTALAIHQGANNETNPQWNEGVRFNKYHKRFYMNNPWAEEDYQ